MNLAIALTAAREGASVANHVEAVGLIKETVCVCVCACVCVCVCAGLHVFLHCFLCSATGVRIQRGERW